MAHEAQEFFGVAKRDGPGVRPRVVPKGQRFGNGKIMAAQERGQRGLVIGDSGPRRMELLGELGHGTAADERGLGRA